MQIGQPALETDETYLISSPISQLTVRSGRHVDCIIIEFKNGNRTHYGDIHGGEEGVPFVMGKREYVVKIMGRQKKHLDGVQFVTNIGRSSCWYGGGGGDPFSFTANAGMQLCGLVVQSSEFFCPIILSLRTATCFKTAKVPSALRLVLSKNVRQLTFGGNPSVFKSSFKGKPSTFRLLMRERAIIPRLMFRGSPSFIRLVLSGEHHSEPDSLFRVLCTPYEEGKLSVMQLMNCFHPTDKSVLSIQQLMLVGKPSVTRQFFGKSGSKLKPLFKILFENDAINGFPSLTRLLTVRDSIDDVVQPSVIEAVLLGEQYLGLNSSTIDDKSEDLELEARFSPTPRVTSLLRLLLTGQDNLLSLLMKGEREGNGSILRNLVTDRYGDGLSLSRMATTNFENHLGHRPALSTYIFGGESSGRASLLRRMIAAEERPSQLSLLRLMLMAPSKTKPSLLRTGSSFRKKNKNKTKIRLPLLEIMTISKPSVADLFFQGEMKGEDSLARLLFGTSVDYVDGKLSLGGKLKQGGTGVTLMELAMVGEEEGGPGFSFIRLLLVGEEDNGFSILRLLLTNESDSDEPSMLRMLLTVLKTVLVASKVRPRHFKNGEWKGQFQNVQDALFDSQKDGTTLSGAIAKVKEVLSPAAASENFASFLSIMRSIPKRGKEFEDMWKSQWLRIAREVTAAGERAKLNSFWNKNASKWATVADHMAHQRWTQIASEIALMSSTFRSMAKFAGKVRNATKLSQADFRSSTSH